MRRGEAMSFDGLWSIALLMVCYSTHLAECVQATTPPPTMCSNNPCQNGGTCTPGDGSEGFTCSCPMGLTGMLCENNVPPMSSTRPTTSSACSDEYAASLLWTQRAEMSDGIVRQRCALADKKLSGGMISRRCDLETRAWNDIDFSECTLPSPQHAFVLLWITLSTGNVPMVNDRRMNIENDIATHLELNRQTTRVFVTSVVASSSGPQATTAVSVSIDYRQLFNEPSSNFSSSLTERLSALRSSERLGGILIDSNGTFGYQGFYLSNFCFCQTNSHFFTGLCENVVPFSPCTCRNEICQCFAPYFIGDNVTCTVDSDGDGFPDLPLPSCSSQLTTPTPTYCIQDNCVEVYNPSQDSIACQAPPDFAGCRLENDRQWDITWGNTLYGEMDVQRCPMGNGFANRRCSSTGWLLPNVMQCDTLEFMSIRESADSVFNEPLGDRPLRDRLSDTAELANQVLELTAPGRGSSLLPVDLNSTNALIDGIVSLLDATLNTTENVTDIPSQSLLDIFNNVLDGENLEGWITLQDFDAGSQRLLDNAERYALYLAEALDDDDNQRRVWQTSNMVIGFRRRDPDQDADDVRFPESLDDLANASFDSIPAEISLPPALFKERRRPGKRSASISSIIFRNMEAALPDRLNNGTSVASMVLSTQVGQRGAISQSLKDNPVQLTFSFNKVNGSKGYRCAYWKFSEPIGDGGWAFDGIEMTNMAENDDGQMVISCMSTHLTSFAVLVDVAGTLSNQNITTELVALKFISYIGCGISIACLLVAIVFFLSLGRELFTKVHYFIHLNLSITLCLGYIAFVAGIEKATAYEASCIVVAALLHYLFLSVFCWMLCEGIMLYLMLVLVFSKLSKKWWVFLIIGYGLPMIPLIVTLGARYYEYGVRDDSGQLLFCWLSTSNGVIWAFVGPMLLIIVVNVVFMVIALVTVFRTKRRSVRRRKSMKDLDSGDRANLDLFKTLLLASLVLLPVLGVTWVLGVFAVNSNTTVFAWLFTIFNSLQGVFILIFHVLRSDKVLRSSRAKRLRSHASSTFRSMRTRTSSLSPHSKSIVKSTGSFASSTFESSTKSTILSSTADKTASENEFQSTRENRLNGTNNIELDSHSKERVGNGGVETKAGTDQSEARNGNITVDNAEGSSLLP